MGIVADPDPQIFLSFAGTGSATLLIVMDPDTTKYYS
jgi:hypothetical protein